MYSWRYLEYRYLHLYTSDKLYIFKIKQILYNRESNKGMSSESEEENKEMKIIMLGAPGAGKGTQAKKISDKYEIPHISIGRYFPCQYQKRNGAWEKGEDIYGQGLLVPDELVVDLVVDRVNQDDCANGYVLDGFPRTIPQAEALDKALGRHGTEDRLCYRRRSSG